MSIFENKGILFNYEIEGKGIPLVILHGLGGNLDRVRSLIGELNGYSRIYMDFRAHGKTVPVGPDDLLNFNQFADDVINLLSMLHVENPILGGISMGAGVAVNILVRYPGFARALVLIRPAWLDKPNPKNLFVFSIIADLLRKLDLEEAKQKFMLSNEYRSIKEVSSDVALSLISQFTDYLARERCARLERMPASCPVKNLSDCNVIKCPTLVVVTDTDSVHPLEYGSIWKDAIPLAELSQITAKSISETVYVSEFRKVFGKFLLK